MHHFLHNTSPPLFACLLIYSFSLYTGIQRHSPMPSEVIPCFPGHETGCLFILSVLDRLAGLMVKASASGTEDSGFESRLRRDSSGSSHTSDLKIGIPVATLPGAWRYRVSAGTGRPGVSILWLGETESLAAASFSVWQHVQLSAQIHPWDTLACCWDDSNQPTNKSLYIGIQRHSPMSPCFPGYETGACIMEADDSQVTTVFTVQSSFHYRHSTNRVSWSVTIVGERRGEVRLHVCRRWQRVMILGLSSADGEMTVGLWKLSSLDGRRPPGCRCSSPRTTQTLNLTRQRPEHDTKHRREATLSNTHWLAELLPPPLSLSLSLHPPPPPHRKQTLIDTPS